jgi:hypothetical protein
LEAFLPALASTPGAASTLQAVHQLRGVERLQEDTRKVLVGLAAKAQPEAAAKLLMKASVLPCIAYVDVGEEAELS